MCVESELSETAKSCADFQKKCAGFFNQVIVYKLECKATRIWGDFFIETKMRKPMITMRDWLIKIRTRGSKALWKYTNMVFSRKAKQLKVFLFVNISLYSTALLKSRLEDNIKSNILASHITHAALIYEYKTHVQSVYWPIILKTLYIIWTRVGCFHCYFQFSYIISSLTRVEVWSLRIK